MIAADLSVPTPTLGLKDGGSGPFPADKPLTLTVGPITLPDGAIVSLATAVAARSGYLLYRDGSGGDVWDERNKAWIASASSMPTPQSMLLDKASSGWNATLVALGQKDAAGSDKFDLSRNYWVQCVFVAKDNAGGEHEGASRASAPVALVAPGADNRAGLLTDPQAPTDATRIWIFLKDAPGGSEQGRIGILQSGAAYLVELVSGGASVTLSTQGEITVTPALGRPVTLNGDLDVTGQLSVQGVPLSVP